MAQQQHTQRSRAATKRVNNQKNLIYADPLPVRIHPTSSLSDSLFSLFSPITSLFFSSPLDSKPPFVCRGTYDPVSRAVWVTDHVSMDLLWTKGFFGKGVLSRSEPTWKVRQENLLTGRGGTLTAEELTAQRRLARKEMKIERAKAAVKAGTQLSDGVAALGGSLEGEEAGAPDAVTKELKTPLELSQPEVHIQDLEHLQLTLQEALFLAKGLGCLEVFDEEGNKLDSDAIYSLLITSWQLPFFSSPDMMRESLRPDNPALINYVVYHHYRSLGWVIKNGIKFCVDYLLYKRGPVFHHAEFSLVLIPTYEDARDAEASPFSLPNATPRPWNWLSTVNRVNSQIQKTLILVHVTIPAISRLPPAALASYDGFVDTLERGESYSIREVSIRRYVPSRMRL